MDSGWGIQPHWLLDRLWVFADEDDRQAAAALVQRFQATIHQQAAKYGWTLDSTHDLTRVLRIPGTLNHKLTPVPVRLLSMDPGDGTDGPTRPNTAAHLGVAARPRTR